MFNCVYDTVLLHNVDFTRGFKTSRFLLVVFCAFAVVEFFVAAFNTFARRRKKSQNVELIYLIV